MIAYLFPAHFAYVYFIIPNRRILQLFFFRIPSRLLYIYIYLVYNINRLILLLNIYIYVTKRCAYASIHLLACSVFNPSTSLNKNELLHFHFFPRTPTYLKRKTLRDIPINPFSAQAVLML